MSGANERNVWGWAAIIFALATLPVAAHGQTSGPTPATTGSRATASAAPTPVGPGAPSNTPIAKSGSESEPVPRARSRPPTPKAPKGPAKAVWDFLNSEFIAALVAGIVGAGVGAYGGAAIVRRQQDRKAAREEVRAVNVAIAHVLFILNWTIALRRQHLRGMVAKYKDDCARREAILKLPGPQVFQFTADMETLPVVELPTQSLRATVYDRLDVAGPAYAMCATLASVVSVLLSTMEQRNDFLEEKRRGPAMTHDERAAFYFGLPRPDGALDQRYPAMLDALSHYSEATVLYAMVLAAMLMDHGKSVAEDFGKKKPKVTTMNLAAAFAEGLVPDLAEYKEMFQNMGIDAAALLTKYGAPIPKTAADPPTVPST